MGLGSKSNLVYLVDFGLSKRYKDGRTNKHIRYSTSCGLTGTARYKSLNAHLGIEQSRRDDLESVGYVLLYFLRSNLPWQGIQCENKKQKLERIGERKKSISMKVLCKDCPNVFYDYFKYCRELRFDESPNYAYIRHKFRTLFVQMKYVYDNNFDWKY